MYLLFGPLVVVVGVLVFLFFDCPLTVGLLIRFLLPVGKITVRIKQHNISWSYRYRENEISYLTTAHGSLIPEVKLLISSSSSSSSSVALQSL